MPRITPSASMRRIRTFAAPPPTTRTVKRAALPSLPGFEKRQLARRLLATLSPLVLAEAGYLERRGGDRDATDPRSMRAVRLRLGAARAREVLIRD